MVQRDFRKAEARTGPRPSPLRPAVCLIQEAILEALKSGKLNLVDFLLFSGQGEGLGLACRVQLVSAGKFPLTVNKDAIVASARKKRGMLGMLAGRRSFMSSIKYLNSKRPVPDGLNFYERAVYEGADDNWFPGHYQAMVATYNRMGLMKEGNVGYRGEELRGMYQSAVDGLMSALKNGSTVERARLLNDYAAWYYAFFALPLPGLEPKQLKAHVKGRNVENRDALISDGDLVAMLDDAALHALAAVEMISG